MNDLFYMAVFRNQNLPMFASGTQGHSQLSSKTLEGQRSIQMILQGSPISLQVFHSTLTAMVASSSVERSPLQADQQPAKKIVHKTLLS